MTKRMLIVYIARRVIILGILLVLASFLAFSLLYLAPGNTIDILIGINPKTPETVRALREQYHLNDSFMQQYWTWLRSAASLNFGNSIQTTLPVTDELKARWPISLALGSLGFLITLFGGLTIGILAALKRQSVLDRTLVAGVVFGTSTPAFVTGVFLLYLFAVVLPWFPAFGRGAGFFDELWHLALPAVALALTSTALIAKHTRAAVIKVIEQDYIVFARARGLSAQRVLFLYVLRNALIPVVTISVPLLAYLITGAVLVEQTFSLAGIGQLAVQSAETKDIPMLQGITLFVSIVILVGNLVVDLLYMVIDPRIRLAGRQL